MHTTRAVDKKYVRLKHPFEAKNKFIAIVLGVIFQGDSATEPSILEEKHDEAFPTRKLDWLT